MAKKFLTAIDLSKNELQNAQVQNLPSAPASPVKGQLYFNSTDNTLYWCENPTTPVWIPAKATGGAFPGYGAVPAETTFGIAKSDGASTAVARADHTHGSPTHDVAAHSTFLGAATADTAFGSTKVDGVATTFSRSDHTHGNPTHDATAHSGIVAAATAATTFGLAKVDGVANTLARSDHHHGTPTHDNAAHSAITLNSLAVPTTVVNMNSQKITSLADPQASTDAANKQYVDNLSAGLSWKDNVRAATTANITLSAPQTIDGVAVIANERVLVKNQTTTSANGIYTVAAGAWVRALDADTGAEMEQATVYVAEGTTQADTAWVLTTNAPLTLGTTGLAFAQFAGSGVITAGAGLLQTGNVFDVQATNGSIVVAADSIGVGFSGTGSAVTAAKSDHTHTGYDEVVIATADPGAGYDLWYDNDAVPPTPPFTQILADPLYVNVNGDTMTAPLVLPGNPTNPLEAAPKQYVDTQLATAGKRYAASVGGATSAVVAHNLNTRDVLVNVYRVASPYDTIECDVERTDVNNVTLRFAVAPAASEYRAVVVG